LAHWQANASISAEYVKLGSPTAARFALCAAT
jgi:hypothetical protein